MRASVGHWHLFAIPLAVAGLWVANAEVPAITGMFTHAASLTSLFSTIIGALASILGVTIGVVLVTLQVIRATYSGNAVREVLRQRAFGEILALYLLTMACAMIGLVSLGDPVPPRTIALSYLALGLFFVSLALLPSAIAQLLHLTRISGARIEQLVATITGNSAAMLARNRSHWEAMTYEYEEEDPLFVLTEIAVRSLREHDRVVPGMIVRAVGSRVVKLLHQDSRPDANGNVSAEWRDTLNGFMTLFRSIATTAAEVGDERTLIIVVRTLGAIHRESAVVRIAWDDLIEFNQTLKQLGITSIRLGLEGALRAVAAAINAAMVAHLKHNVGSETAAYQLWDKPPETLTGDWIQQHHQWSNVAEGYTRMLSSLADETIKRGLVDETNTVIMYLTSSFNAVADMEHLGLRQRRDVIDRASFATITALLALADKTGTARGLWLSAYFRPDTKHLKAGFPWAKVLIGHLCYAARELARRGVLDDQTMNVLGTLARGTVREVVSDVDICAEAVVLLAETIAACAVQMNSCTPSGDGPFVREASRQLDSIEKWGEASLPLAPIAHARIRAATGLVAALPFEGPHPELSQKWPQLRVDTEPTGSAAPEG
jgi:hypothetical protein